MMPVGRGDNQDTIRSRYMHKTDISTVDPDGDSLVLKPLTQADNISDPRTRV